MRKYEVIIRRVASGEQAGIVSRHVTSGSDFIVYRFPRNSMDVVFHEGVNAVPFGYDTRFQAEISASIAMQYLDPEVFEVVLQPQNTVEETTEK